MKSLFFLWNLLLLVGALSLSSTTSTRRRARIPVLQYHDDWVCVEKPCGLTVHRSKATPKRTPVLTSSVKRQLARKVFPVHRLDHRTSGAILFAFDSETAGRLHDAAIRKGKKQYIALVRGEWSKDEEEIIVDLPLNVKNVTKEAQTKFTLLATTSRDSEYRSSLVLCEPITGRTHQIRRHAFAIGHPIIGDTQHGESRVNRLWRQEKDLNRLALHCWTLNFSFDDREQACIAPLSMQLQEVLKDVGLWETATSKEPRLAMEPFDLRGGTFGRHYRNKEKEELQ